MGRRPGVFVRPVSREEGRRLRRISRTAKDPVKLRNERGSEALDPKRGGDAPRMIGSQVRQHICLIARTSPALRYFALNGTDHRSHGEQNAAINTYVRWRNHRAEPKANFAPGSPIRTWTRYPAKSA